MFKFKKNKLVKTGVHTPKFRNPTPPPPLPKPPTSGSNAVKPRPTAFYISPGDLNDWVKTVAQIGDVAYCYIREVEEYGVYYYLEPDDNPFWRKIGPEFLKKYFKKENKEDKEVLGTMNCTYSTPCGWCTKWDKKCDKKIGHNETITYLHDDQEVDWANTSSPLCGQGIQTTIKGDLTND